jgi:putative transposase
LVGADRMTIDNWSGRPDKAALHERRRVLAGERRHVGRRRLHVRPYQERLVMNRTRTGRLRRGERLSGHRRRGRKSADPGAVPAQRAARWTSSTTGSSPVAVWASSWSSTT